MSRAHGVALVVCAVNALTSLGFSAAALAADGAALTDAGYAFSRSLALAAAAIVLMVRRSQAGTLALAGILTLMQAGDAVIGLLIEEPLKYVGPALLALLTGWAGWRLWATPGGSEPTAEDEKQA